MAKQADSTRDQIPGFGSAIRARREAAGLSLAALAERVGAGTPATLSKLELGQRAPSLRLARDVAAALGVTVDALLIDAARQAAQPGQPAKPKR